jgi:hypothetical protein
LSRGRRSMDGGKALGMRFARRPGSLEVRRL